MNTQEILNKYSNETNIKKISLDEIIILIKANKFNDIYFKLNDKTKLDKYDILDNDLSEQILNDENLHQRLFYLKIRLNFNDDLAQDLLNKNYCYIQTFSSVLQIKFKDFILQNPQNIGFRYLCDELKYDFDFLTKYIKSKKDDLNNDINYKDNIKKQNNYFNLALNHFKPNQAYNKKLLECFTNNDIELFKYNLDRFKLKDTFTLKDALNDIKKYKKILLNDKNNLKQNYINFCLNEINTLNDDEFKTFIENYSFVLKTLEKLIKDFNFTKRFIKLKEYFSIFLDYLDNNNKNIKLTFNNEQAKELISINEKVTNIINVIDDEEDILISFANTSSYIKAKYNKFNKNISELISIAYTNDLIQNPIYSNIDERLNIASLIINDNTATFLRYNDTTKTTEKEVYSFNKLAQ
ncbi:hypothetical protein [Campylobacter sp. MG1]|uniref:hypothetical protein n=1 Tax=Campylobacter sp. MG1 TaxID=2976332 RepID=UPI00226D243A|nr:hypothetical protein [Campylobacter sp. MG1]